MCLLGLYYEPHLAKQAKLDGDCPHRQFAWAASDFVLDVSTPALPVRLVLLRTSLASLLLLAE